jgi:hypothetical protein
MVTFFQNKVVVETLLYMLKQKIHEKELVYEQEKQEIREK